MIDDIRFVYNNIFGEDSENEEEDINIIERPRLQKVIRNRLNDFDYWQDKCFKKRFRLSKESVQVVLDQINGELSHPTHQNNAISPLTQLLVTLRFYATGSTEMVAGDFVGISESSACQIIYKVSEAIARLAPQYIRMPLTNAQQEDVKRDFFSIARFPNVIGAIDCTHVRIQSPGGDTAEQFRNRKGYFSINVQTISDSKLKFINIVARWPGSVHDKTIFDNSVAKGEFEQGLYGNSFLLGDSGYNITKYMMTPLLEVRTRPESLYNESQIRTRNVVERKYGVWKQRFPILRLGMRIKIDRALTVIVATAVLHNIALDMRDAGPDEDNDFEVENIEHVPEQLDLDGVNVRNSLINDYFATL